MRGSKLASAAALLGAITVSSPAAAQSAEAKLKRGLTNLALGVVEIPGTIKEETHATNPVQGFVVGFIKGSFRFVRREMVGVYEIATFPAPIPADYRHIVEPEKPWAYLE